MPIIKDGWIFLQNVRQCVQMCSNTNENNVHEIDMQEIIENASERERIAQTEFFSPEKSIILLLHKE